MAEFTPIVILGIQNKFYSLLTRITEDKSLATTLALDEAESAYEYYVSVFGRKQHKKDAITALNKQAKHVQHAVSAYAKNYNGSEFSQWILELPDSLISANVQTVFSEAVLDHSFANQYRLQLLIVCWATQLLRAWTDKMKEER